MARCSSPFLLFWMWSVAGAGIRGSATFVLHSRHLPFACSAAQQQLRWVDVRADSSCRRIEAAKTPLSGFKVRGVRRREQRAWSSMIPEMHSSLLYRRKRSPKSERVSKTPEESTPDTPGMCAVGVSIHHPPLLEKRSRNAAKAIHFSAVEQVSWPLQRGDFYVPASLLLMVCTWWAYPFLCMYAVQSEQPRESKLLHLLLAQAFGRSSKHRHCAPRTLTAA